MTLPNSPGPVVRSGAWSDVELESLHTQNVLFDLKTEQDDQGTWITELTPSVGVGGTIRSAGIVARATPKAALLVTPTDGAVVTKPPLLRWVPTAGAAYYNVQLYRLTTKTFSVSSGQPGGWGGSDHA